MNFKRSIFTVILISIVSVFIIAQNVSYATQVSPTMYLGLNALMTDDWGYAIGDPLTGTGENSAVIWNLVEYDSETATSYTNNRDIFCLREGEGFIDSETGKSSTTIKKPYTEYYNMKTDKSTISNTVYNWNKTIDGTVNQYNAILAILDLCYIKGKSSDTYRENLLKNAGITERSGITNITDADIKAVEQAAIWYFTNYGENSDWYDKTESPNWLFYTSNGNSYTSLGDYKRNDTDEGTYRLQQANLLYNYLITTAKANASKYAKETLADVVPAKVNTAKLDYKESAKSSDYIIVGPINISEQESSNTLDSINFEIKYENTAITDYTFVDSSETSYGTKNAKELVGQDIYIALKKSAVSDVNNLSVGIKTNYSNTTANLYTNPTNISGTQPVVIPEKNEDSASVTLTTEEPEEPDEESFDLKLIKRITAVNGKTVDERIKSIDTSKLNRTDTNGNLVTTADYDLDKDPVSVKKGDIVTYTFRIYNEGTIDGYAAEITEDIPDGLEFLYSDALTDEEIDEDTTLTSAEKEAIKYNRNYYWTYVDTTLKTIKTDYLSRGNEASPGDGSNLIKAFGTNDGTKTFTEDNWKEISVKLKVTAEDESGNIIRNEAAITEDTDDEGEPVDDRDSDTEEWVKYEDDEDYDNIILKPTEELDLALRKFIIAVSDDETIDDNEYLKNSDGTYTRAPEVDTSKLNTEDEDGNTITTATYNHTKEPLIVSKNSIVVYMLRVYNEGDLDGYAAEIKDHLPEYLEFVDGEFNEKYGWSLSEDGKTVTTTYLENSKLTKATTNNEGKIVLKYKEVPIMCKVKDTALTNEKITNIADITKYLDEDKNELSKDRDSEPDNVDSDKGTLPEYKDDESGNYIPGQQDDDDFEKIIIKEFDLALRKWVTQAIVIENGSQTITNTGHKPYDDPEQIVKVDLHRKKLNQVTVKFRYSIRIVNEGDVEGYDKEITDYIPEGLKFVAEDNPGWTDEGNNVISTRLLENTLLKPGQYADIEVLLTWVNNENNLGLKVNTAEISEDYNEYGLPDKDSTPDNKKSGEDDIDDAPVMLSLVTGQIRIYFTIGFIILTTIAGGIVLIKKYVL